MNQTIALLKQGIGIPILVLAMLAMMILPLHPFLLDILFTFNIAFSLVVVLVAVYVLRPLEFSVFPTILLVATLLRLAMNVASTRAILIDGHTGTSAAGQVVESFGEVVIGGNYAVGLVIFAILIVINFVVVTKGAGRISEVSARFTLDALPGKQMAIDADLNAGLLSQDEAKKRRLEVAQESDFYGSMDGASKFVRGDAVAGILILFINLLGGLLIGIMQHQMSIGLAIENYALLTIGDGLVAQVPSLLLSTSAAIMVTRVSSAQDIGGEVISQIVSNPRALMVTGIVLLMLGVIPGMPHLVFISLSFIPILTAYFLHVKKTQEKDEADVVVEEKEENVKRDLNWDDIQKMDDVCLELGYRLITLVDDKQGGKLLDKVKGIRKNLSQELGFLIPNIHIKDNLDMPADSYRLNVLGVHSEEYQIYPDKYLAINPGDHQTELEGKKVKEPAFGLDAYWIDESLRDYAQTAGFTVVDASTVVATHISKVLKDNARHLLGYDDVQQLLDRLSSHYPKLAESLIPESCSLSTLVQVLQKLLNENVPIRDFKSIAQALAEMGGKVKDPDHLTEHVRQRLSKMILQSLNGDEKQLDIFTFKPELEQILQKVFSVNIESAMPLEPKMATKIQQTLKDVMEQRSQLGLASVLVVQPDMRSKISAFFTRWLPGLNVLSYSELPDHVDINIVASIG